MTEYEQRMAALGIDRGALASGFPDEVTADQKAARGSGIPSRIGKRVKPALEDYSKLNAPHWKVSQEGGRRGGKEAQKTLKGRPHWTANV